ncbi:MAG: site-specific integrase [Planctomycetes bacterium]|nr:site-specific integrase [Planctomycetota bacterium]
MLPPEKIAQIVREFYEQQLTLDSEFRAKSNTSPLAGRAHISLKKNRALALQEFKTAISNGDHSAVSNFLDSAITNYGLSVTQGSPDYYEFGQALMRGLIDATENSLARDGGDFRDSPHDPLVRMGAHVIAGQPHERRQLQQTGQNYLAPGSRKPVAELIDRFLSEKSELEIKTKNGYAASLKLLDQILKSKPIGDIGKNDIVAFKDVLLKLPRSYSIVFRTRDALRAIKLNETAQKPTLDPHTINVKYLSNLKTFFEWAESNNLVSANPALKVSVKNSRKTKASEQRDPFTADQLQALFSSPIYIGCRSDRIVTKPGAHQVRDHRYWAPLIALFSGARLNEIGQLEVADIVQHNGLPHFQITDSSDNEDAPKKLKTKAAMRLIPIHPELKRLSFFEYVDWIRRQGHIRLFPSWQKGKDGFFSSTFSKWFSRLLRDLGIKSDKVSFHSLRHCFKDALRQARVSETTQDKIMGHTNDSVQARYGSAALLPEESNSVLSISYPGLRIQEWP